MRSENFIKLLPLKNVLWMLLGASVILQSGIISYRHLTGISIIPDAVTFIAVILLATLISAFAGFVLAVPDLFLINKLNKQLRWGEKTGVRICVEFVATILIAVVIALLLTFLSELIIGYNEPLKGVFINNALIFSVVNILMVAVFEGWIFFREIKRNKDRAEVLSQELQNIRFEVLKAQIDPHFMFNNLNTLSALIDNNQTKAQQFIEEFADLYRYVLDTIEKPLVPLFKELDFTKLYMNIQKIRHNDAIILNNYIPVEVYNNYIPPFSLQIAIENAIKHNSGDVENPLRIDLNYKDGYIEVTNNIREPVSIRKSTGLGQTNLVKRYKLISDKFLVFEKVNDNLYLTGLPLIEEE